MIKRQKAASGGDVQGMRMHWVSLVCFCFGVKRGVLQPGQSAWHLVLLFSTCMSGFDLVEVHTCAPSSVIQLQGLQCPLGQTSTIASMQFQSSIHCLERSAAADGSKLPLQQSSHWLKWNANCNGWLSHTCVNSVLVVAPEGLIRCATN